MESEITSKLALCSTAYSDKPQRIHWSNILHAPVAQMPLEWLWGKIATDSHFLNSIPTHHCFALWKPCSYHVSSFFPHLFLVFRFLLLFRILYLSFTFLIFDTYFQYANSTFAIYFSMPRHIFIFPTHFQFPNLLFHSTTYLYSAIYHFMPPIYISTRHLCSFIWLIFKCLNYFYTTTAFRDCTNMPRM